MKKFKGVIYQAINIQNGKSYIGKTTNDFENYKNSHIQNASKTKTKHFYNAIRKYGEHNFKWIVLGEIESYNLEELNQKLNEAEIEAIWLFRTYGADGDYQNDTYGYNQTKGGDGGDTLSGQSEQRKKEIIEKRVKSQTGAKRSEEFKENRRGIKNAFYGKKHTTETRQKMSSKAIGRTSWNKGIPQSKEAKEKNRKAHIGKPAWNKGLKGVSTGKNNGMCTQVNIISIIRLKEQGV